jgi:hypothetical protein
MITDVSEYDHTNDESNLSSDISPLDGSDVSHKIKVVFADEIPTANYKLQVIAAI